MANPTWSDVMQFELIKNPVIFDVGGYKGDWAQIALDKYGDSTIYVFEPVKKFYELIVERYKNNSNIKIFNFGLSDKNRTEKISSDADASSVFISGGEEEIELKDVREFLFEHKIFHVDLIKINIEGEEYRLMEYLSSSPELNIFQNYLIQFHDFIDNHVERRDTIVKEMAKYYDRIFNYEFIFEGWSLKKIQKINCLGDSHISIFSNAPELIKENEFFINKQFSAYRFGPYLAYNFPGKDNILATANSIPEDENLLLCFGEIDCRAQVKNHVESRQEDFKVIIDEIVLKYFIGIDEIKNKNKIIFSVTPELKEQPFFYYYKENPEVFDCPRGTYSERREYKEYFNKRIKEESESRNYKYISIYDYLVNEKDTKEIYYLDDIHLKSSNVLYLIEREIIKSGLIL